jgi:Basic region leucine zipper
VKPRLYILPFPSPPPPPPLVMAPNSLQGLNVVHPPPSHTDSHDLLSGQSYPDLSAQLDLWTHLAFESDEGPVSPKSDEEKYGRNPRTEEEEENKSRVNHPTGEVAIHDGHINVVTGTSLGSNLSSQNIPIHHQQSFDLNTFLAGFGIDPFTHASVPNPQQPPAITPSIAQLLAIHSAQSGSFAVQPLRPPEKTTSINHFTDESYPATKRTRTRKSSVSTLGSPEGSLEESSNGVSSTPVSASEDKRRRNTAASARFRLKKKEREAALEGRAKELEGRVSELERECEGLRRENGWLKGLVVGVTGAASQAPAATGNKRTREEAESIQ